MKTNARKWMVRCCLHEGLDFQKIRQLHRLINLNDGYLSYFNLDNSLQLGMRKSGRLYKILAITGAIKVATDSRAQKRLSIYDD